MKLPKELREKKDLRETAGKTKQCSVVECNETAIRSLNENQWSKYIEKAKLKITESKNRKIYLCKAHYKEANKLRKSEVITKKGFLDNKKGSKKGSWDHY